MRVFVLGTGRCGTKTFARACERAISNYTTAHESRAGELLDRIEYPDNHVEVDHRLTFFMGPLLERYRENEVLFVHLTRAVPEVVRSWASRGRIRGGLLRAWMDGIIFRPEDPNPRLAAEVYVEATVSNIRWMLTPHPGYLEIPIEDPHVGFDAMWDRIGAQGDPALAHALLEERVGASRR